MGMEVAHYTLHMANILRIHARCRSCIIFIRPRFFLFDHITGVKEELFEPAALHVGRFVVADGSWTIFRVLGDRSLTLKVGALKVSWLPFYNDPTRSLDFEIEALTMQFSEQTHLANHDAFTLVATQHNLRLKVTVW